MAKRVLWLLNHSTLRKFEVPLLIELGYEVFCPKKHSLLDLSASISYEFDASLSIPEDDLAVLNRTDFYSNISRDAIDIANKYFDIAICMLNVYLLDKLATSFYGAICLQAFGLEGEASYSATMGIGLLSKLKNIESRFWFLPSYENLNEVECSFISNRTLLMPIGLVNIPKEKNWNGGDERFLFVCPRIKTNSYYREVYQQFKDNFGDIPHVIGGGQIQDVAEDVSVLGFLQKEEYDRNMKSLSAMYYHSHEPRHLHYHPLEAVVQGMPLVFMAGGMLDYLGGKGLPGRAENIKDARRKLKKLIVDKRYAQRVVDSQKVLLEKFTVDYCKPFWINGMETIDLCLRHERQRLCSTEQKKKVAIIMPNAYLGGVLDFSIRFAKCINAASKESDNDCVVVFGYPQEISKEISEYTKELRRDGIETRPFLLEVKDNNWAQRAAKLAGFYTKGIRELGFERYVLFRDGICDFLDCDYFVFTADCSTSAFPFFVLRPFAIVVHDCIQRYFPNILGGNTSAAKKLNANLANWIYVTSKPTLEDVIQFGENARDRAVLCPLLLDIPREAGASFIRDNLKNYFVWSTNASPHKNHLIALDAIEEYYRNGGTLECIVTGANTECLNPTKSIEGFDIDIQYVESVRKRIRESQILTKYLLFKGNMRKEEYYSILKNSRFSFSPGYGDNGNAAVVDAAGYGVPCGCADYPAMRYLADFMSIAPVYFSPFDSDDMAKALKYLSENYDSEAKKIPSKDEMIQNTFICYRKALYSILRSTLG